jgi:hypothetical protein
LFVGVRRLLRGVSARGEFGGGVLGDLIAAVTSAI